MSFHEVQFPPSVSQGAEGGPRFSTTVLQLTSGFEQRNINWSRSRGEWDVSHGLKTQQDVEALLNFFHARNGKAYAFRFKDWGDYRVPRWRSAPGDLFALPVFFTTDGSTRTFQLVKVYGDGANTYTRLITKPVSGTLELLDNGVNMTTPADWSCNFSTGVVTLSVARASTTGHTIAGACEFDVPARFDTDDMRITTQTTDNYAWGPIPIVEVREIT